MRLTIHVPEELGERAKQMANTESTSVSKLVAEALERYILAVERRRLGHEILALAGKVEVRGDALDVLDEGRTDAGA